MTSQLIFAADEWQLTDQQAQLCEKARELAASRFAERAYGYDRDATFPTENYHDLHQAGLLAVCIPEHLGGFGADLKSYMLMAAEIN